MITRKKLLWFIVFALIFAWFGKDGTAQITYSVVIPTTPPGGLGAACNSPSTAYLMPTGGGNNQLVVCTANVWAVSGGGGGGGGCDVSMLTNGRVVYANSGACSGFGTWDGSSLSLPAGAYYQQAPTGNIGINGSFYGNGAGTNNSGNNVFAGGLNALSGNIGKNVTGVGVSAGSSNTGNDGVFAGYFAGSGNSGLAVVATGFNAGLNNQGNNAVLSGYYAGISNTGSELVASGYYAAFGNTGDGVVATGPSACYQNTGHAAICLGDSAGLSNTFGDVILIGAGVTAGADHTTVIGNSSNTDTYFGGTGAASTIHVAGCFGCGGIPAGGGFGFGSILIDAGNGSMIGDPGAVYANVETSLPTTPSVDNIGTPGAATYSYCVTQTTPLGESVCSSVATTATSQDPPDGTNYNEISTACYFPYSQTLKVYLTAAGAMGGTGFLGTVTCGSIFNDMTGMGDGFTPPSTDTTVGLYSAARFRADGYSLFGGVSANPSTDLVQVQINQNVALPLTGFSQTSSDALKIDVIATPSADWTSNSIYGINSNVAVLSSGGAIPGNFVGAASLTVAYTANGDVQNLQGTYTQAYFAPDDGTSTVLGLISGSQVGVTFNSAGTVPLVQGIIPQVQVAGGAQADWEQVINTYLGVSGAATAVTNAASIYVSSPDLSGGPTLTNLYGLFVADQAGGANNWAIKTGAGLVEFGGTLQLNSVPASCMGQPAGTVAAIAGVLNLCP